MIVFWARRRQKHAQGIHLPHPMNERNTTQAGTLPFPTPAPRAVRPPAWHVRNADAFQALRDMEPATIDAVITDPPYGIGFMNRKWDTFEPENQAGTSNAAFQAWTQRWAQLALVASKPGANWIVAGSPQTTHRAACGLEDAGLRIVTTLIWLYGQGWPKGRRLAPGLHTSLKPAWEPMLMARTPSTDTAGATYARYGTGGFHIDACRLDTPAGDGHWSHDDDSDRGRRPGYEGGFTQGGTQGDGRWPPNVAMDAATRDALDLQVGNRPSGGFPRRRTSSSVRNVYSQFRKEEQQPTGRGRTSGTASRFFYCPKASHAERNDGLEDGTENAAGETAGAINDHETVKPLELMRWLIRLVAPPGGVVLDPFSGSGTTGVACMLEGRSFIGIERDTGYAAIAEKRIRAAATARKRADVVRA